MRTQWAVKILQACYEANYSLHVR